MKKQLKRLPGAACIIMLLLISCSKKNFPVKNLENLPNTEVLKWNEIAFNAFGGPEYQNSLMASRINAMVHIAIHDALNAIQPNYGIYAFTGSDAFADPVAATASAAHTVLVNEIPTKKNYLDSALQLSVAGIEDADGRQRGIALGKLAGQAIISERSNDGSASEVIGKIPFSFTPGVYQAVPPFDFVFAPAWKNMKPFSLQTQAQFRCAPQPALQSPEYATAFNEVKETGKNNSVTRTAEQTFYSKFWYEFSEAGWNRIARVAATGKRLNLFETARLFALVDMAIADAYIAGWDSKFHYNFWRPYTAILNADADSNDNTEADAKWQPAEPTPPVQDYPSTHSALGNAGATVLARLLGDNTGFTTTSFTAVPADSSRTFKSFSEAANENADSRVRAGIHFRFSCEAGQDLGNKIGHWTVDNHLKPLK